MSISVCSILECLILRRLELYYLLRVLFARQADRSDGKSEHTMRVVFLLISTKLENLVLKTIGNYRGGGEQSNWMNEQSDSSSHVIQVGGAGVSIL